MRRIRINGGLRLPGKQGQGALVTTATESVRAARLGIRADDYRGIVPSLRVQEGARVDAGSPLFVDRFDERVRVVSPVAGTVAAIERGSHRRLRTIVLDVDGDSAIDPVARPDAIDADPDAVVAAVLDSGLWPALRQRPFERIADPSTRPQWLFVTAIDTRPGAPDVADYLRRHEAEFAAGIDLLRRLPRENVFVCVAPDGPEHTTGDNVEVVGFDGPHPAGLVGTHMHYLADVGRNRPAWHIGYQDVVAIGRLAGGQVDFSREVCVPGTETSPPRRLRALPGTALSALAGSAAGALQPGSMLDVAGSGVRFLGRYDNQLSELPRPEPGTTSALARRLHALRALLAGVAAVRQPPRAQPAGRSDGGLIPLELFDRVWPFRDPVVPLLRAVLAADADSATRNGLLALADEDFSLCRAVCPQRLDYPARCRDLLQQMAEGG